MMQAAENHRCVERVVGKRQVFCTCDQEIDLASEGFGKHLAARKPQHVFGKVDRNQVGAGSEKWERLSSGAASDFRDEHALGDCVRDPSAESDAIEYFVERAGNDFQLVPVPLLGEELHLHFRIRVRYCGRSWCGAMLEAMHAAKRSMTFRISERVRDQICNAFLDAVPAAGGGLDQAAREH